MSRSGERLPASLYVPVRQEQLARVHGRQLSVTRGTLYIPERHLVQHIEQHVEAQKIEQQLNDEFKAISDYYHIIETAYQQIAQEVAIQENEALQSEAQPKPEKPAAKRETQKSKLKAKKIRVKMKKSKKQHIKIARIIPEPTIVERKASGKEQLALLLPAHNEELIIEATIKSAIAAGQDIEHIYVVNDNSTDKTRQIATRLLGKSNVLNVKRSGKALAVKKATTHFKIIERYDWLHVADADSIFSKDYFHVYRRKLDPEKYAVALGFVQSLRGNWISSYRALTYTHGQQVDRRIQSALGMITVFPGPVTCLRTDIINKLSFEGPSLTEDFDITLQVHRKKLGNILYIPQAVNYTQDPQNLSDFCKQNLRWMRGFFQGVKKYGIGLHGQRIDAVLGFQMLLTLFFLIQVFVIAPLLILTNEYGWLTVLYMIALDFIINFGVAIFASILAKRWNLVGVMPYFYFLRFIEIGIHVIAFFEVFVLHKFSDDHTIGWSTAGRRYKLSASAMSDVAH